MTSQTGVSILGIFVADTAYLAPRMPAIGETLIGSDFKVGPGGKGSNQAVAAARAGADVSFISKIGNDTFGELAHKTYADCGVTPCLAVMDDVATGAAFIYVNDETGDNAIIVYPGASGTIDAAYVESQRSAIENSRVFVTQLEQPADAAQAALSIARNAGVTTVFNPAPVNPFPEDMLALCDFIVPNETEAQMLVGFSVDSFEGASKAGEILCERGAKTAVITLGERGAYIYGQGLDEHIPAITFAPVVETTGAGDAFVGGFASALADGLDVVQAATFGSATAAISVTRRGTAPSMPERSEILDLLNAQTKD